MTFEVVHDLSFIARVNLVAFTLYFALRQAEPQKVEIPTEFDFIQHYYGQPGRTHSWNEFRLRPQVAEKW